MKKILFLFLLTLLLFFQFGCGGVRKSNRVGFGSRIFIQKIDTTSPHIIWTIKNITKNTVTTYRETENNVTFNPGTVLDITCRGIDQESGVEKLRIVLDGSSECRALSGNFSSLTPRDAVPIEKTQTARDGVAYSFLEAVEGGIRLGLCPQEGMVWVSGFRSYEAEARNFRNRVSNSTLMITIVND